MDGGMGSTSDIKIGDLVKIDWEYFVNNNVVTKTLRDIVIFGVVIDTYKAGGYKDRGYIIIYTTEGEYKTFSTDEELPPTITVLSNGEH